MLPLIAAIPGLLLKGGLYLLKNPRVLLFGATALTFAFMWIKIQTADHKIAALALENSNLRTQIVMLSEDVRVQKEIVKITDERIKEQEQASKNLEDLITKIDQAPESDNGPVAPVLKRTLEMLP